VLLLWRTQGFIEKTPAERTAGGKVGFAEVGHARVMQLLRVSMRAHALALSCFIKATICGDGFRLPFSNSALYSESVWIRLVSEDPMYSGEDFVREIDQNAGT
jgi:hypothetical protein